MSKTTLFPFTHDLAKYEISPTTCKMLNLAKYSLHFFFLKTKVNQGCPCTIVGCQHRFNLAPAERNFINKTYTYPFTLLISLYRFAHNRPFAVPKTNFTNCFAQKKKLH
jgi:hypothetical protein